MNKLVDLTHQYIKDVFKNAEGGHDYWHTYRVWKNSILISQGIECDLEVVELAALLHDIADSKFNDGDEKIGPEKAKTFLIEHNFPPERTEHVIGIIENISFKGGNEKKSHHSIELDIVQDADRLEAIGAVGIARAFNYGGYKNRAIFDPNILPNLTMTKEEYKKSTAPTINHFYEKLLLLKNRFNTKSGKLLAQQRHEFLEMFLEQFFMEVGAKSFEI